MLGYINSEIHKTYGALFNPQITPEAREEVFGKLRTRFGYIDKALAGRSFLLGEQFTVADAYLFVMVSWADYVKLDLSSFANVQAFQQRVGGRPGVQAALKAEGLM
jgi:glutathione S-transferase